MMDNKPLVSIGMPVYNGENYIRQALDSLLTQAFENFELVISDNASTDATQRICLEYAAKDPRIQYHRNAVNTGLDNNFNRVFELSSGKFFMWAAHDDIWEPNFVSRCLKVLRHYPSVVLCYPQSDFIGPDGEQLWAPLSSFDTRGMNLIARFHVVFWGINYNFPIHGLIRSEALKRTRLLKNILGSDIILLTELSLLGHFAHVPAPLFHNRLPSGDWLDLVDAFTRKIDKPVTTKWSALYWYLQMIYGYVQAVNTHVPDYASKAILISAVVLSVPVKYRWLLKALLDLSRRKRGKG